MAQNLAREGVELAYSLRNSGSLRHVDDPATTWASYITNAALKSGSTEFCNKYDLGDMVTDISTGFRVCKQSSSTQIPDDQCPNGGTDNGSNAQDELECDKIALANYLYEGWAMPPGCAGNVGGAGHLSAAPANCDYDNQGELTPDISDLTALIDFLFLQSYQFNYGYPAVAATGSTVDGSIVYYNPGNNFNSTYGQYTGSSLWWADDKAKVKQSVDGTFVQYVTVTDATSTKFYRVVSMQPICRGSKSDVVQPDVVASPTSGFNCVDYAKTASPNGLAWAEIDAGTMQMVGVLVTSEVR